MSVKAKSVTSSQTAGSNISETTIREDKGQNRPVIESLRRVRSGRVFLTSGDETWTYGDALWEVERRLSDRPRIVRAAADVNSIIEIVAGLSGGGVTVVGPRSHLNEPGHADMVVYTSGSTGEPKGVRLKRANLVAAASASAEHLGHGPDDDWLLAMPLHHVGGLSIIVRQIWSGGSITLLPSFEPRSFAEAMKGRVTMASLVPTMLQRILPLGPFGGLRAVLVGGGPIPEGLLEGAVDVGIPVLPTYGMTETFGQVATLRPGAPVERKAHPLPGVDIRIEPGGVIAVAGDQVSPGYVGEPDRPDRWFVTSDVGSVDDDGALRVLGRSDTMIISGGENVSPEKVESILLDHPGVDEVVVVGVEDARWGQMVVGAYTGSVTPDDLTGWAGGRLAAHMVPKRLKRVREIPRTAVGKPDRGAVRSSLGGDD